MKRSQKRCSPTGVDNKKSERWRRCIYMQEPEFQRDATGRLASPFQYEEEVIRDILLKNKNWK